MAAATPPAARALPLGLILQWLASSGAAALRFHGGAGRIPRFDVNLDDPPRERWKHIVPHFRDWYIAVTPQRQQLLQTFNRTVLQELIAAANIDEELMEEIRGIHEEINYPEATLELALLGHLKYELGATQFVYGCSGIVAAMENGTMVHGRNFDLAPNQDWSKVWPGFMHTTFWRGGQPLFQTIGIFSLVAGFSDGIRLGSWSVQHNTRLFENSGVPGDTWFDRSSGSRGEWAQGTLQAIRQGAQPFAFMMRRHLQDTASFDDLVAAVRQTAFAAPFYLVIAGAKPFQGAVVTVRRQTPRDGRHASHDVRLLSPRARPSSPWYLVQTNDDYWRPPGDLRRNFALMCMDIAGTTTGKVTLQENVWGILRSVEMCNNTWFTWMAVPAQQTFQLTTDRCAR